MQFADPSDLVSTAAASYRCPDVQLTVLVFVVSSSMASFAQTAVILLVVVLLFAPAVHVDAYVRDPDVLAQAAKGQTVGSTAMAQAISQAQVLQGSQPRTTTRRRRRSTTPAATLATTTPVQTAAVVPR
jgi:hypothetical protein